MRHPAALPLLAALLAVAPAAQAPAGDEGEGRRAADAAVLAACLEATVPRPTGLGAEAHAVEAACIGRVATPCMEEEDGGHSTLGMTTCSQRETVAWDTLLNEDWPKLMADARAADAYLEDWPHEVDLAAEALRAAQRAWIAWRAAECRSAYADWGVGSMRHIAGAGCWMRLTAERTIEFRLRLGVER